MERGSIRHRNDGQDRPGSAVISEGDGQASVISSNNNQTQNEAQMVAAVKTILRNLGEDPNREGLLETPERFVRAMQFFTQGYHAHVENTIKNAMFEVECNDLVVVRDIEISSLCEHHLVPFVGKVHIGYVPRGRVIGLSKLARIAEIFARRLQIQERLTREVAFAIEQSLKPDGVAVVMECSHLCMSMRGVQQTGATTVTRCKTGVFEVDEQLEERFDRLLNMI